MIIVFYIECPHCGDEVAESRTLMLDQPEANGELRIDVEMSVGQNTYTCVKCGCQFPTGDIDIDGEGAGECPYEGEDAEAGADDALLPDSRTTAEVPL